MAGKLWRKVWTTLNAEISVPWESAVKGGAEGGKAVLELAKVLNNQKAIAECRPSIAPFDSLLDVLNSPIAQLVGAALPFLPIATRILISISTAVQPDITLEESVILVSQAAYLESLRRFLGERPEVVAQLGNAKASAKVAERIKRLGEHLDAPERGFDDRLARDTLLCFHASPLAEEFNAVLAVRLQEAGLAEAQAYKVTERVSRNTHRYLKEAVAQVRDKAKVLAAAYGGDGWLRDLETYSSLEKYLEETIASKPEQTVFDEEFTFRDIYVPLEVKPVRDGKVDEDTATINIETWAAELLADDTKAGRILFVQGGPGRGKSVFCRMFADWVRRELHPIYTPILIRLRDVTAFEKDFDKTLSAAVGWDFAASDGGWLTDRNTRFLFLLDGFDELLLERGTGDGLEELLEQISKFQKRAAENPERGHRVLITGRSMMLVGLERKMPTNLEWVEIALMSPEIQAAWSSRWEAQVGTEKAEQFRQFLANERCPQQVGELAREPLLLYLLAAMHRDDSFGEEIFAAEDGDELKVRVYQAALEWVLTKQRTEDGCNLNPKITDLEEEDLYSVLAEAALCVVQSGNERASIRNIEDRLLAQGNAGAKELIEAAKQTAEKNPLKNALAAFYLKHVEGAENSVEFFHKSFGEFLCAKRMAETLTDWTQKTGNRRKTYAIDEKTFDKQVYDLMGYGILTGEIVGYLRVLLQQNAGLDWGVLYERLHEFYLRWSDGEFIELFDVAEENLPLGKARQLQKYGIGRGQRQVDIYTGLNVLILLLELHRYGQSREEWQDKIRFHPCGELGTEEFDRERLLRIIGYSECLEASTFRRELGQFLSGTDLSGVNLSGADFNDANLSGADLSDANLGSADFLFANLSDADISGTSLLFANLLAADLSCTNLSKGNLFYTNLGSANLGSANLSCTNLSSANLREVRWDSQTQWANAKGLHTAMNIPENLAREPKFAAAIALSWGAELVHQGNVDAALASYFKAQQLDRQLEISAFYWGELCWHGSLYDRSADVLFAGDRAVELEPDNGSYRDTRGLARVLTGDISGAIEDFQAAVDSDELSDTAKRQRQGWLEALRAGENPFTPEVLGELRGKS